jgi:signal transduction histidine kinase
VTDQPAAKALVPSGVGGAILYVVTRIAKLRRCTDSLGELRRVLDLTRADDGPREQPPTLTDLDGLVSSASGDGTDGRLQVRGERHPLPAVLELAAYRIVQESLTNVVRHAKSPTVTVTLTYGRIELELEILDRGCGDARLGRDTKPLRASGSLCTAFAPFQVRRRC